MFLQHLEARLSVCPSVCLSAGASRWKLRDKQTQLEAPWAELGCCIKDFETQLNFGMSFARLFAFSLNSVLEEV